MTSTSTSAEGWHARATPHPDASTFQPSPDALVFVSRMSTMASPDSFTMALFRPDAAVDASGRVLGLQPRDFATLALLADDVARLPDTGAFQGFWVVSSRYTCRANDYLHVKTVVTPKGEGGLGGLKTTGVYAWEPRHTELGLPTAGYEHLPPALHELVGYAREAYAEKTESEEGGELIRRIRAFVQD
ncbi:hypothetical protein GSI_03573 [Ganoderma sinense ZZ0214-1]|uniref:Uncharacterized protein n=1 Tax=Ganoderma sinense ZZ0214-1 TaxID=1077348 RepID=A0A2G8SJH7_9APHY|nr:hypothetical protein GSI_03573 [Ganoderma sinense ZZ0214-1]